MAVSDESPSVDSVEERFAHLHYHAASVRLEMLAQLLNLIDKEGGIERAPTALVAQAIEAAEDVAENLRWAHERLTDGRHRRAEVKESGRRDSLVRSRGRRADAPRGMSREGEKPSDSSLGND